VAWNQQTAWLLEGVTWPDWDGRTVVRNMDAWKAKPTFPCLLDSDSRLRRYNNQCGESSVSGYTVYIQQRNNVACVQQSKLYRVENGMNLSARTYAGCEKAKRSTELDEEAHSKLGMGAKPPHKHCHLCDSVARVDYGSTCAVCGEQSVEEDCDSEGPPPLQSDTESDDEPDDEDWIEVKRRRIAADLELQRPGTYCKK